MIVKENCIGQLGQFSHIKTTINNHIKNIEWEGNEGLLNIFRGVRFECDTIGQDIVESITTYGGYDHLYEISSICKELDAVLFDCQSGKEVDLNDPYSSIVK